jgi:hypothetical protein
MSYAADRHAATSFLGDAMPPSGFVLFQSGGENGYEAANTQFQLASEIRLIRPLHIVVVAAGVRSA